MAKRKRKMTLFDVMHAGAPQGLQVRDRSPRPEPRGQRPAAWTLDRNDVGRGAAGPVRTLSAADKLAEMRGELSPSPRAADDRSIPLELEPTAKVVVPREPRKPIGQSFGEAWAKVSPAVNGTGRAVARGVSATGRGASSLATAGIKQARRVGEIDTRYAFTAGVALAAVVLLGGAFYVGKLLIGRPTNDVIASTNLDVRSDVLDVAPRGGGDNVASLANRPAQATLERRATPAPTPAPKSTVFGGRDLNLNYVVIETYGSPDDAAAAVDVLAKYKVRATVEKNVPGWGKTTDKDRFMVVGLDGFSKISTSDYANYIATLDKISEKEAGTTLPARLKHGPYKYRPAA